MRTVDGDPAIAVVTERHHSGIAAAGGFGEHAVVLPEGTWVDVLTGAVIEGGAVLLSDLLATLPATVLRKEN